MDSKTVIKTLQDAGWEVVSVRGSHHKLREPNTGKVAIVPHPKKDLPIGTLRSIEKQSGIKF
jgi:predicted RNA binding protein YcfA (HicA-like mRNA interferase family)